MAVPKQDTPHRTKKDAATTYFNPDKTHKFTDIGATLYLLRFSRPWFLIGSFGFCAIVSSSLAIMGSARAVGNAVELGLRSGDFVTARIWLVRMVWYELLAVILLFLGRSALAYYATNTVRAIRLSLFSKLQSLPARYFDRTPLGRTVTRLTNDVDSVEDFFAGSVGKMGTAAVLIAMTIPTMIATNAYLGTVAVLTMIPCFILTRVGKNIGRSLNRDVALLHSGLNARFSEYIKGIPLVRSFRLEYWAESRINESISSWLAAALRMNIATATIRPLIGMSSQFPLLVTLWLGFHEVQTHAIGIGVFVTFLRLCERFSSPVVTLSQELHQIQTAFASAERVASMVKEDTEDAVLGADGTKLIQHLKGSIEFYDVTLQYDRNAAPALKNISFAITPGETIGFVGKTGSGKSSTVALIARLYQQSAGKILLDGIPIEELQRQSLRSAIGFVTQDPVIFAGSLRENLSLSESVANSTILETCAATGLEHIMHERHLTLEDQLTEGGNNLSAGERQVIALTRMLLQNPSVIILDEATANIDETLEHTIHKALVALTASRTTIIIAHRLSTLKACNRIIVFKDGSLVEQGTHEKLLSLRGYYFELAHTTV